MNSDWKQMKLIDIIQKTETINPQKTPHVSFDYIDVSSICNKRFVIQNTSTIFGKDAPSRARKLVRAGDILFATIRPTLKRIAQVPKNLDRQVCSTGYFVFRPKDFVEGKFLFYFLFTEHFMGAMEQLQKGASYPAVNDSEVGNQTILIPPLPEQKRIVTILDEAFERIDRAIANTEKNLANSRKLFESIIQTAIFADCEQGDWSIKTVEDVLFSKKGSIRTGTFGSQLLHSEFVDEGIAVLGIDNAVENEFKWGKKRFITPEKFRQLSRYQVKPGDVLITIMGTCGRCAIVPDDIPVAINSKHLCCITLDYNKCLPSFLHAYFLHHPIAQRFLTERAKGSIMSGLNMEIIKELPLHLPPLSKQQIIIEKVNFISQQIRRLESIYRQKVTILNELKQSILQKAFTGELTADTSKTVKEEIAA